VALEVKVKAYKVASVSAVFVVLAIGFEFMKGYPLDTATASL
jgi:hypothetical protein